MKVIKSYISIFLTTVLCIILCACGVESTVSGSTSSSSTSSASTSSSSTSSSSGWISLSRVSFPLDPLPELEGTFCETTTGSLKSSESGYEGESYLDLRGIASARVDYPEVYLDGGPLVKIEFILRYANGGDSDVPMALWADGFLEETVIFPPTGSWSTWSEIKGSVDYRVDDSPQLSLMALSDLGGPLIDSIRFDWLINCYDQCGYGSQYASDCPAIPLPGRDSEAPTTPKAMFIVSAEEGRAPFTVQFDASASRDADQDEIRYHWDFGDGGTATGKTTSHTFDSGNHITALTVTDDDGNEAGFRRWIFVE